MLVILFQNPHSKLSTSQLSLKTSMSLYSIVAKRLLPIFSISLALLANLYCMEVLYKILSWENSTAV